MQWPEPLAWGARDLILPEGVWVRQLVRADVRNLPEVLRTWRPELEVQDPDLLDQSFYNKTVALLGEETAVEQRPVLVLVFETDETPVAYLVLQYDRHEQTVVVRRSVVAQDARDDGLSVRIVEVGVQVARALGMYAVYASVALDDRAGYAELEANGFRLWGLLPNAGRRQVGTSILFTHEAALTRPLVSAEDLTLPAPDALIPRTAALMKVLYDQEAPGNEPSLAAPAREIDPVVAAAIDARPGGRDRWPDLNILSKALLLSPGVVVRQMSRGDIPTVIEALAAWHPALPGSLLESLLTPAPYESSMALLGEEASLYERPGFPYVAEVNGELSVFALYSFDAVPSRTLRTELAVINPRHRGINLSLQLVSLWRLLGRAVGADTLIGWATLTHPFTQRACARQDLDLVGISPVAERLVVGPGPVKYVCEALYAASLVPEEQTFWPPLSAMPERVAALARFIYGRQS